MLVRRGATATTLAGLALAGLTFAGLALVAVPATAQAGPTTAWHNGHFAVGVPGTVRQSDVVLGQPNLLPAQAMPLGNGSLGIGLWSANGLTAQLNRADTLPDRLSPGQLTIPGLAALTSAPDYHATLDLYDGVFTESGGGMTARAYVPAGHDELVVDVTGANPATTQTAQLALWQPRTPTAAASGAIGSLAQTWVDQGRPGSSGDTFGAMAAITATARNTQASVVNPTTVGVQFRPNPNGAYQILVDSPQWTGGNPQQTARSAFNRTPPAAANSAWWHRYWNQVGPINMSSSDGVAQYLANVRTVALYAAAAERGTVRPGSQAGVADLFDSSQDTHSWDPASYWGWNLRMMVTANLGAGAFDNNDAYFAMYANDLASIESWTASQFPGTSGACIPETMRFNGVGIQVHQANGQWGAKPYLDCSGQGAANYNARTLTTGAEVSLFIWQTYQQTDNLAFLRANYPVMAAWAKFILSYAKLGTDGNLHTSPSNAHETQWDVSDPTTDIAAMRAVLPDVAGAARLLHQDPALVSQIATAVPEVVPYPLVGTGDQQVIGMSYQPAATIHNVENIGLEPVWPYGLIGDAGQDTALAQQTFALRPNVERNDWSLDPIDAARLGRPVDLAKTLVDLTEQYQLRPSGLAAFGASYAEPYAEQGAVVATALQDALVQDYDGLLRVAPAWPGNWDVDGTVYIQHRGKVDVQIRNGAPVTVAIQAGASAPIQLRNPWPGQQVQVVDGAGGHRVIVPPTTAATLTIPARAGASYLVEPLAHPTTALPFAPVGGTPATTDRQLGAATIGLPPKQ
ncbi:MAG TPA: hypothetical protein VJ914_23800 [Pseudonocardiaceae bacterium]|nr:hypothetical protein [Pseudonocardiaceae bacterium]